MVKVKIGIIGGTGFDNPDLIQERQEINLNTPFGLPSDSLIAGEINGIDCVLLARHGRKHHLSPSNVNYRANVWALKELGCTHVIATTATGSLKECIKPGDFVIIDDFIDRTYKREQTFFDGKKESPKGICHITMNPVFCIKTRCILIEASKDVNIPVHKKGTCVIIEGPRFSTKAESLLYKSWNCDLVNMTLVPEVVLAKEIGFCYAAIAMATDYDCWHESEPNVDATSVVEIFRKNFVKLQSIILKAIEKISEENWDNVIEKNQETINLNTMK